MQWKRLAIVAVVGAAVMFTLVGCGRGNFATVGGDKITKDEFYKRLENLPVGGRPAGMIVLNQMIDEHLWMQLAKKEGVPPTDDQVNQKFSDAKKAGNLAQQLAQNGMSEEDFKAVLRIQQAQFNVVTKGIKVSDAEIKAYYDKAVDTVYTTPERVKIAAIICKSKDAITKANAQIKNGTDFSAVVINLSEDPMSKQARVPGELGWVWRGQKGVPDNLIGTAFSLKKGEISSPFQVVVNGKPADWVIIQCKDHEQKKVRPLDEVKTQISQGLAYVHGQQSPEVAKKFAAIREEAKIKINSDKYHMQGPAKDDKKGKKG